MTRVIIRFKDGEHMNIPADCIDLRDGWIFAWKGDFIVAIAGAVWLFDFLYLGGVIFG
jgi:hypothetical protein